MTEADKLTEAERELATRRRVYPRWVAEGKMTQEQAAWRIECMAAIVADYNKIVRGERLI